MVSEIVIGPLVLRMYGVLVAAGLVTAAWLAERRLQEQVGKRLDWYWDMVAVAVVGGLIGARLWHVATDWPLYAADPVAAIYIWRGGLSIVGGLLGGIVTLAIGRRVFRYWRQATLAVILDAIAVAAPVGQAIGRLGNWVNQELFGLPTNVPWKLYIEPTYRPTGFEQEEYFHPLFAYEAIALLVYFGLMQVATRRVSWLKVGSGNVALLYLGFYGALRFVLEFLRIEKTMLTETIGVNQGILAGIAVSAICWLVYRVRRAKKDL